MANAHDLLMAQRAAMIGGKSLPYLRRVAYLESHGTEYTKTGFFPNLNSRCAIDFQYTSEDGIRAIFGTRGNSYTDRSFCIAPTLLDTLNCLVDAQFDGVVISRILNIAPDLQRRVFEISKDGAFRDGVKFGFYSNPSEFVPYGECFLFGRNSNPNVFGVKARIFHVKFFKDNLLSCDFIPVIDLSGRPCMYNQAPSEASADDSSRFFYNQGTGEFTWGELET